MIADASLRWICTALFTFAAGWCLFRVVSASASSVRIGHGLHLSMCTAMIAMAWPWGDSVPLLPQGVFFSAATVWFTVSAFGIRSATKNSIAGASAHGSMTNIYHAVMMAAMVWMLAVMAGGVPGTVAHHHTVDSVQTELHSHTTGMSAGAHANAAPEPAWVSAVSLAAALAFGAAAIIWLHRMFVVDQQVAMAPAGRRTGATTLPGSRLETVSASSEVAMAAGMAIMFGVM
ncbi:DUF5134 domain-containing protein [Rhodococcus sp. 05-2256-B2]|nr:MULTISPECIES: DUF5134 domain-containing protein [Rhodococcus]RZL78934.1 MAG: DUF5134 domain-containing protein [Rhodococcus sp. (in: high G+C Gram-positive bacteria)]OZD10397.1 DUF5134 domain-containing protein [Rhodococcus sp. 06-235-1A]OZD78896.1 DUF5134 domain-containing protein [Rhodococcus sp. 05-2256-B4]OZD93999.1 DUF5134 domain-containing protein [Rhodococcus sp. 05-2256-B3]OZE01097.1 DUF5134 domain-containing protein [Rhodococcus sp. 05-2256-B2]